MWFLIFFFVIKGIEKYYGVCYEIFDFCFEERKKENVYNVIILKYREMVIRFGRF